MPARRSPILLPISTPTRRHVLTAAAALALACSFHGPLHAAGFELRVVTGDATAATQQALQILALRFPGLQSSAEPRTFATRPGIAVYVTLGPAALQASLEAGVNGPLLSLFTSNEAYRSLVGTVRPDHGRFPTTAIYAEPAPQHQMRLIRAIYHRRLSVAVILTDNTSHLEAALRQAASAHDLDIVVQRAEHGENMLRALARLESTSVLLAVPDRDIFAADTLRNLLESTYRRNQAVIGFSAALVRAGTLASGYSTVDDTLAQARDVIEQLAAGVAPVPQYPLYWRVTVNESVARSLNVPIDDEVRALGNPPR